MYHREYSITPTQQATDGSLDIFVEGYRKDNVPQMLFGLSVLRRATEAQVNAAKSYVQASQHVTLAEIDAMLAR